RAEGHRLRSDVQITDEFWTGRNALLSSCSVSVATRSGFRGLVAFDFEQLFRWILINAFFRLLFDDRCALLPLTGPKGGSSHWRCERHATFLHRLCESFDA